MNRIDPERGPLLAAGGVLLAAAVLMLDVRFDDDWATGVHLIIELAAFVVIFGLAWLSPRADRPQAYQATLAITGLVVLAPLLFRVADVLGVDDPGSGTLIWISAVFTVVAWAAAGRFDSVGAALLGGIGASLFVLAVIDKVFDPEGVQTFRWVVTLLAIAAGAVAASIRGSERPKFAVAAVDVAGVLIVTLGATFALTQIVGAFSPLARGAIGGGGAPGFGWKLVLIAGSLAVIAYAAVSRERGPAFIGALALVIAVVLIAEPQEEPSVVGWPLVLLLAALAALALGLRPRDGGGVGGGPAAAAAGTPGPPGGGAAVAPPAAPEAGDPPAPPPAAPPPAG